MKPALPLEIETLFVSGYDRGVEPPAVPDVAHVWVRPTGQHGETVPGVVLGWHRDLAHSALASGWVATVACIPYGDALLVQAVPAERLVPVRDAQPRPPSAERQPS